MKARRVYSDYLKDILEACQKAVQFIEGMSYETFANDDKTQYAVVRALTVIGEAAKKIPKLVQNRFPNVPWKLMAGMRDIVVHEYFRVDLKRVFETVRRDLPPLTTAISSMLIEIEKREQ
ncbi:MAG TPA: DUF86 domain-containing protein [Candidatus Binatia bacterium]|nr:DUF86 domain-containing protein [Candidatus Binatia bacterium]